MKIYFLAMTLCIATSASSQWSSVILGPAGYESRAVSIYPDHSAGGMRTGGYAVVNGLRHASLWTTAPGSWQDIHPPTLPGLSSEVRTVWEGVAGRIGNHGALWSSNSWSLLTPFGVVGSEINGMYSPFGGRLQGGSIIAPEGIRASIWRNIADSCVDLHPVGTGFRNSTITGALGAYQSGYLFDIQGNTTRRRAGVWVGSAGSWRDLHPAGATDSYMLGPYCGAAVFGGATHAAIWDYRNFAFSDLHPTQAQSSVIRGGFDVSVGEVTIGGARHAAAWSGSAASFLDLHQFLPTPTNFSESSAYALAGDGNFYYAVGSATNAITQKETAVLWSKPGSYFFTVSLNRSEVTGEGRAFATISALEPGHGTIYFRISENSSVIAAPVSAEISASGNTTTFAISAKAVSAQIDCTINVTNDYGLVRTVSLRLKPTVPSLLTFTPSVVTGGQTSTGKVFINGTAGVGGRVISTFDNSPYTTLPTNVTIPSGATSKTFPVNTTAVTATKLVTVTARVSAGEKTGTLRINP